MSINTEAATQRREPSAEEFQAMQKSEEFKELRGAYRSFTFPMSVAFFLWYVAYVLLSIYLPDTMKVSFLGMNVGLWLGVLQFVTTFLITWAYVKYANKKIEPKAAAIRATMEGQVTPA